MLYLRTILPLAALAATALAHADPFNLTIDTNVDLHDGVAVYNYDSDTFDGATVDLSVPSDLATGAHTLASSANRFDGISQYTYLAVFDEGDGTEGISIGLDAGVAATAIANETPFEELLGATHNESDVVLALHHLQSGDPILIEEATDQVTSFVRSVKASLPRLYPDLSAADGTMTRFSGATYGGSIAGTPVPEPVPVAALGLGTLGLLRRRRACRSI